MKLCLGVLDVPYVESTDNNDSDEKSKTTGDVAEFLENQYGIMEYFTEKFGEYISEQIEKDLSNFIENALKNQITSDPFSDSCQHIERKFKMALQQKFMDDSTFSSRPVPTQAAKDGINHRFKDSRYKRKNGKKVKRDERPSFVDTGLYRQSFKAWVEL